jgi:heme exporter protein B
MALVVGLRQSGMLLVLVTLPLYVPVLIFGASAVNQALLNLPVRSELGLLAAISILSITLAPFAATFALRASVN